MILGKTNVGVRTSTAGEESNAIVSYGRGVAVESSMFESPRSPGRPPAAAAAAVETAASMMMAVSGEQAAVNGDNSSTGPNGIVATANDAAPQAIAAMEPEPSRQLCTTGSTHTQATHPQTREQVFARRLITRGALSYSKQQSKQQGDEVTTIKDAVLAFNSALYNRTMSPSSTDFDGNIDVELLNAEIFRVGDVWASRNLLCNALNCRECCQQQLLLIMELETKRSSKLAHWLSSWRSC